MRGFSIVTKVKIEKFSLCCRSNVERTIGAQDYRNYKSLENLASSVTLQNIVQNASSTLKATWCKLIKIGDEIYSWKRIPRTQCFFHPTRRRLSFCEFYQYSLKFSSQKSKDEFLQRNFAKETFSESRVTCGRAVIVQRPISYNLELWQFLKLAINCLIDVNLAVSSGPHDLITGDLIFWVIGRKIRMRNPRNQRSKIIDWDHISVPFTRWVHWRSKSVTCRPSRGVGRNYS